MKNVTIRITSDIESSKNPPPNASGGKNKSPNGRADRNVVTEAAAFYVTAQTLMVVRSYVQTGFSRYIDLTEDYMGQNAISNVNAHIERAANVAITSISGAKFGAKFGPIGAIVGAVFGAGIGVARNELERRKTLADQNKAIHEDAYSVYFNTARAGMVNYSRGTEN